MEEQELEKAFDIERLSIKYPYNGSFTFMQDEKLSIACKAPKDKSGIYFVFKESVSIENLLYVGSSGRKINSTLIHRKGGIRDRIVNGKHSKFDREPRRNCWPKQMLNEKIEKLLIYWWITYDNDILDFPTDIEHEIIQLYRNRFECKPPWHQ